MKEAACSCLERMNLIFSEEARAFRSSLISSPGRPKTYSTPSFSRQRTNSSAAFIWHCLGAVVINGWRKVSRPEFGIHVREASNFIDLPRIQRLISTGAYVQVA